MAKIGKKFHCHPSTVQRLMRKYRIRSRTLSEATQRVIIPKKILKKLYYQDKLSTEQIGKLYHCNHVTILNKMKAYGLKRRSKLGLRKPILIPKEKLKDLYLKRKFSVNQIAKKIKSSRWPIQKLMKKYKIKSRSLSEAQMKYPKYDFSGNLIEKAYLIGFRLGDLYVTPTKLQIEISCSTSRPEQVKLIKSLFNKYTRVKIRRSRFIKGQLITDIKCLLNKSFKFLFPKQDKIPSWILKNKKFFFAFLAGYIDAEGHIFTRLQKKSKTPIAGLQLASYDKGILHQIWSKLNEVGIECPKPIIKTPKGYVSKDGIVNNQDEWRLDVNRKKALFSLFTLIEPHIKHSKRRKDLLTAKRNVNFRLRNRVNS